ncbi:Serine/threonine-protein kinase [Vanrija albida]|uniref:non-specific serine/threonine protein kinase n=1 Tax=Vanrija albida TaxID=181172 RepID=A0ABR3QD28_9TREE
MPAEDEVARKRDSETSGSHSTRHRERIGNYVVGVEIGRGSFATVYKGHRSKSKVPVAIKAVSRQKLTSKLLDNLESEINILKAISHRNIVALIDCFKNDTHIYLVMEYCSGADLSIYLKNRGRIETLDFVPRVYESGMVASRTEGKVFWPHPATGGLDERVTRCFLGQLAEAVKFLRSQDLIHRDIKPQNLLLQPPTATEVSEGHPLGIPILKVADFGFARILPAAAMAETLCGSPLYMAPEILRYEKYDARADLWSIGAVLYEMAVGRSPFRAPNHVELLRRIERGDDRIKFPDESSRAPTPAADGSAPAPIIPVSADIKQLIRSLLKRHPSQRMGFDDFFACGVWDGFMVESVADVSTSIDVSTDSSDAGYYSPHQDLDLSAERERQLLTPALVPPSPASPTRGQAMVKRTGSGHNISRPGSTVPTPVTTPARPPSVRRSEPKYYVGDEPAEPSPPSPSPTGGSPAVPRPIGSSFATPGRVSPRMERAGSSADDVPVVTPPGPLHALRPVIGSSPLAATPPITVTGKDDAALGASDSVGREYVVVEKRTVEINELADELEQQTSRRPSVGAVVRKTSMVSRPVSTFRPTGSSPPTPQPSQLTAASYSPPFAFGTTPPPFAVPAVRQTIVPRSRQPSLPGTPTVFPPPGTYAISPDRHSASPSSLPANALARVLTNTAVRLLNSSANTAATAIARATGTSTKKWPLVERSGEIDPDEGIILDFLEDTARKAYVLFDLADQRLLLWSQTSRQPSSISSATITSTTPPSTNAPPFSVPPVSITGRRKSSASSTSSDILALRQQEAAAGDACALYFKSLAFICAGHERFKQYWEARSTRNVEYQTSAELNELVQWFRARFNEVYEKAEWTKARCADELPYVDRLVHDRARDISRQSAQAELLGDLAAAEDGYENAMWLLDTLLDDAMYEGVKLRNEDRLLFEHLIGSIRDRLDGVRRKLDASRTK